MDQKTRIKLFVEAIWNWYSVHKRELPWRDLKDADPTARAYKILVSEVMLQQTQVSRVKIVFIDFLRRFPKISDLAQASNRDVLLAWRGMGYNSRALRLRDAARTIVARSLVTSYSLQKSEEIKRVTSQRATSNETHFPQTMEELRSIPGVGHYTAGAIRNFAFNLPTPCIDTNIRRILHRTFVGPENADGSWKKDDRFLLSLVAHVLEVAINSKGDSHDAKNWHAALMDFGSLVQTKNNPKWDVCPLTARGIMKTNPKNFSFVETRRWRVSKKSEPGRMVGSKYIPNRIFRGKIVEALRDAERGLTVTQIGREVCIDWNAKEHELWLKNLIKKLVHDRLIDTKKNAYVLAE